MDDGSRPESSRPTHSTPAAGHLFDPGPHSHLPRSDSLPDSLPDSPPDANAEHYALPSPSSHNMMVPPPISVMPPMSIMPTGSPASPIPGPATEKDKRKKGGFLGRFKKERLDDEEDPDEGHEALKSPKARKFFGMPQLEPTGDESGRVSRLESRSADDFFGEPGGEEFGSQSFDDYGHGVQEAGHGQAAFDESERAQMMGGRDTASPTEPMPETREEEAREGEGSGATPSTYQKIKNSKALRVLDLMTSRPKSSGNAPGPSTTTGFVEHDDNTAYHSDGGKSSSQPSEGPRENRNTRRQRERRRRKKGQKALERMSPITETGSGYLAGDDDAELDVISEYDTNTKSARPGIQRIGRSITDPSFSSKGGEADDEGEDEPKTVYRYGEGQQPYPRAPEMLQLKSPHLCKDEDFREARLRTEKEIERLQSPAFKREFNHMMNTKTDEEKKMIIADMERQVQHHDQIQKEIDEEIDIVALGKEHKETMEKLAGLLKEEAEGWPSVKRKQKPPTNPDPDTITLKEVDERLDFLLAKKAPWLLPKKDQQKSLQRRSFIPPDQPLYEEEHVEDEADDENRDDDSEGKNLPSIRSSIVTDEEPTVHTAVAMTITRFPPGSAKLVDVPPRRNKGKGKQPVLPSLLELQARNSKEAAPKGGEQLQGQGSKQPVQTPKLTIVPPIHGKEAVPKSDDSKGSSHYPRHRHPVDYPLDQQTPKLNRQLFPPRHSSTQREWNQGHERAPTPPPKDLSPSPIRPPPVVPHPGTPVSPYSHVGPGSSRLLRTPSPSSITLPVSPATSVRHYCVNNGHVFWPVNLRKVPDNTFVNRLEMNPYLTTPTGVRQHVRISVKCELCNTDVNEVLWVCEVQMCRVGVCMTCAERSQAEWEVRATTGRLA